MEKEIHQTFYPKNIAEWRQWLEQNHHIEQSIWLVQYKKSAAMETISWSEAVDEALCFGWIDSTRKSLGDDQFVQYFCRRKPKSNWSKINKDKVAVLIEKGLMREAGLASIEVAKQNGSWTILDAIEELEIPEDFQTALKTLEGAENYFHSLSKSVKKMILHYITFAKRPETRKNRINEVVELASKNQRPKQFM